MENASKTRYCAWYVSVETAHSQQGCSDKMAARNSQPPSTGVRSLSETKHSTLADSEAEDTKNAASATQRLGKQ